MINHYRFVMYLEAGYGDRLADEAIAPEVRASRKLIMR